MCRRRPVGLEHARYGRGCVLCLVTQVTARPWALGLFTLSGTLEQRHPSREIKFVVAILWQKAVRRAQGKASLSGGGGHWSRCTGHGGGSADRKP